MMVSSSCSTNDRGRVTLMIVGSSCSSSDRSGVILMMVSRACSTGGRGRVTLVMISSSRNKRLNCWYLPNIPYSYSRSRKSLPRGTPLTRFYVVFKYIVELVLVLIIAEKP